MNIFGLVTAFLFPCWLGQILFQINKFHSFIVKKVKYLFRKSNSNVFQNNVIKIILVKNNWIFKINVVLCISIKTVITFVIFRKLMNKLNKKVRTSTGRVVIAEKLMLKYNVELIQCYIIIHTMSPSHFRHCTMSPKTLYFAEIKN